jgi:hypothetical protein
MRIFILGGTNFVGWAAASSVGSDKLSIGIID